MEITLTTDGKKSMKKLLIIGLIWLPTLAIAQEKEFDFKLNEKDIAVIGEALGMMPYAKVAPLMVKLQQQINAQTQPPKPKE